MKRFMLLTACCAAVAFAQTNQTNNATFTYYTNAITIPKWYLQQSSFKLSDEQEFWFKQGAAYGAHVLATNVSSTLKGASNAPLITLEGLKEKALADYYNQAKEFFLTNK